MTTRERIVFWIVAYGFITLVGYSFALALGDDFFPTRVIVVAVFVSCCVHAIMQILDWPKDRQPR